MKFGIRGGLSMTKRGKFLGVSRVAKVSDRTDPLDLTCWFPT